MTPIRALALAAIAALALSAPVAPAAAQEAKTLSPARPQPSEAALEQGLAVRYARPSDIRTLERARSWEAYDPEPGPPLVGFDYPDTLPGEETLTSGQAERVIAFIDGYIRFPEPGIWKLQFHSNDGLEVNIGGREVYRHDGRHTCQTLGWKETYRVPEAGWYPVEALFFQRMNTSCLLMEWQGPNGTMTWTPNDAFAYEAE
jgi:hypothetical protein